MGWDYSRGITVVKENSGCAGHFVHQTSEIRGVFWGFKYVTNIKIYYFAPYLSAENYTINGSKLKNIINNYNTSYKNIFFNLKWNIYLVVWAF